MRIFAGKGAVVAALALGLFTSYIAWRYVDQEHSAPTVQTTPVAVAAYPINARTIISPDMVRIQQMPADAVHAQSLQSVDQVVGKVAKESLTSDEPILTSKLYLQRGESGLAFMVPQGMRAISVGFSEAIGSGGMVVPGDHVDIIGVFAANPADVDQANQAGANPTRSGHSKPSQAAATQSAGSGQDGQNQEQISLATLVLQDVEVLAVAQQLEGEAPPTNNVPSLPGMSNQPNPAATPDVHSQPASQPGAKTATLAVTPDDALKLVLAEEKGRIRLALRRNKDTDRPVLADVPQSALLIPAR